MNGSVAVAFNSDQTRAALRFTHPTGNIITADIIEGLTTALETIPADSHLKLLTLEGAGRDFSFGASIPEHAPATIGTVLPAMHRLIDRLLDAPAPTAAVVRGRCLGGGFELALACDFIFSSDAAMFGLPEIALGVFPPAAAALLPLRTGGALATRTILTGEHRSAADWHRAGLLEIVAPAPSLDGSVDAWYEQHLAPRSAAGLRHAARAARHGIITHLRCTLPELERLYLGSLMKTYDAAEGVAAFLEKRRPVWRNE